MSEHIGPLGDAAVSGVALVPGNTLVSLASIRMNGPEWRVVVVVMLSPDPVSAKRVAARLRLDYGLVKRVGRELIRWNILERTPEGLRFQPDHTRWGPPRPREAA